MKKLSAILMILAVCTLGAYAQKPGKGKGNIQPKVSVSIFGDSYSTFRGYLQPDTNAVWYPADPKVNDVRTVEQTWWHLLITEMGWKLCRNNSYSGSTIAYHGYNNDDYRLRSFENRKDDLGDPDVILIFGGTNDSWSGSKVGEYKYSDWDTSWRKDTELYTYRPALAKMLDYMTKRYLNVKIYFILNSELREEINESSIEICRHYNVPVIRLKDIDKQQGHPSVKGMRAIADQVKAAL